MALETVTLVLGPAWTLVSGAATGPFEAFSRSSDEVLYVIGDAQPADDYEFGMPRRSLAFASLTAKVWARSPQGRSLVTMLRTVFAGNAAELMLPKVGLSATGFSVSAAAGADVATITGRIAGDAIESFSPNDGRIVLSADRTKFVRGLSAVSAGTFDIEIVTWHPLAPNAPKRTKITLTVTPVVRGLGNGMQTTITGLEGGAIWSRVTRTSHSSNRKLKRSRVTLPTSYFTGANPMVETDLAASLKFMVSLEPVYLEGLTGIPARTFTYLFGGSKVALYNGPGTNPTRKITSDWLDHTEIPANQKFGLWTTVENQLGAASPAGTLPLSWNTSSFVNRNEGTRSNVAQDPGVSYVDTNATETRATMTAFAAAIGGSAQGYWPALIEIEYDNGERVVFLLGDSMFEGVGLAQIGPDATSTPPVVGDVLGPVRRNRGYGAVGIDAMGINHVNAGKGSDGFKNLSVDGNMVARLEHLKATNPTHVLSENVFNDAATVDATWLAQVEKVYGLIEAAVPGIKIIQALAVPYTTSTRAVTSLVYNNAANLATVTVASTADLVQGQTVTHSGASVAGLNIRAPINITGGTTYTFSPPAALGADQTPTGAILYNNEFRSAAGQTPVNAAFTPGAVNSRSSKNQLIRSRTGPFARCFAIFDPNLACEEGYTGTQGSETGKWQASPGLSFRWVWDGGHQNNSGQLLLGAELRRQAETGGWFS